MLATASLGEDARLLDLLVEAAEGALERLVLTHSNFCQSRNSPPPASGLASLRPSALGADRRHVTARSAVAPPEPPEHSRAPRGGQTPPRPSGPPVLPRTERRRHPDGATPRGISSRRAAEPDEHRRRELYDRPDRSATHPLVGPRRFGCRRATTELASGSEHAGPASARPAGIAEPTAGRRTRDPGDPRSSHRRTGTALPDRRDVDDSPTTQETADLGAVPADGRRDLGRTAASSDRVVERRLEVRNDRLHLDDEQRLPCAG